MTNYELASVILQSLTFAAVFGTLYVYYRQLRVMSSQLNSMQNSSNAQSAIELVNFLQDPEIRAARHTVRAVLSKKPIEHWDSVEKEHASRVASNYDVTAALLKENVMPASILIANWGPSIIHCYSVLKPWIESHQQLDLNGPKYWSNFKWLYDQAIQQSTGQIS